MRLHTLSYSMHKGAVASRVARPARAAFAGGAAVGVLGISKLSKSDYALGKHVRNGGTAVTSQVMDMVIPARTSFDPLAPAAKGRPSRVGTKSRLMRTGIRPESSRVGLPVMQPAAPLGSAVIPI